LQAEKIGVKVLCLGALNKAESINGGGVGVIRALGPNRRLSVIHGNHLTAAAVVETVIQCFSERNVKFFLTGASSKVGWAVAQALREYGYDILCHSTDRGRRQFFERYGFASASTLREGAAFSKLWIVGKYDKEVAREIPQNAVAVVFSVPHPLASRKDVRVIEAATLHLDITKLDSPRVFTNKLRAHEIFACHAASAVAVYRLRTGNLNRITEVGPVDTKEMNSWLVDAKKLGFSVPLFDPVSTQSQQNYLDPVVIVGGGPAGLCVAAGLTEKQIPNLVLEASTDPDVFGSWNILARVGTNVTTQKQWCNLPGYNMSDKDFPNEYISPQEYQRYLKQYSNRFSINMQRGQKVVSVNKESENAPWLVVVKQDGIDGLKEISASSIIIATGKHRVACENTSDDIVSKLRAHNVPYIHTADMTSDNWKLAIEAATRGTLCIVGFGNSAADISSILLQHCNDESKDATKPMIHIAARSVPPVFPQKLSFLRVDTLGHYVRMMPGFVQEKVVQLLWNYIPSSRRCDSAFPSHLNRWGKIHGRIPVIDKGFLVSGFNNDQLRGHGQILDVNEKGVVFFDHSNVAVLAKPVKIELVILATGFKEECVVDREARPNGLYKLGFGNDKFLPLRSTCDESREIVKEIAASYQHFK
jgi:hypothetical protein